jgi:hypothetical protein
MPIAQPVHDGGHRVTWYMMLRTRGELPGAPRRLLVPPHMYPMAAGKRRFERGINPAVKGNTKLRRGEGGKTEPREARKADIDLLSLSLRKLQPELSHR